MRTVLLPNFKAVSQTQASYTCRLKVEILDACVRPLFTNPATVFILGYHYWEATSKFGG